MPDGDAWLAELADSKVIGDNKLVATVGDSVLADVQFLYGAADPARHWLLRQRRLRLPRRLDGTTAVLAASNGDNCFHWLFDSLPRLHLLALAGHGPERIDHYLLSAARPAFQDESLNLLGLPAGKRLVASRRSVLECPRLLVPSMPGPVGLPPRWVCDFLRRGLLGDAPAVAPRRRLYVSRARARGRRIDNEADLLPLLARHGYEVVHAEALTFRQQIDRFATAERVVAMHGAGLSNLVFVPPGGAVLELASPRHNNTSFQTLAARCGLRHHLACLEVAGDTGQGRGEANTRFANVVADPAAFARALERLDDGG